MARISKVLPSMQQIRPHNVEDQVECEWKIIVDTDGSPLLHLSTFGSSNRASKRKSSQSIQLSAGVGHALIAILVEAFGTEQSSSLGALLSDTRNGLEVPASDPASEQAVERGVSTSAPARDPVEVPSTEHPLVAELLNSETFDLQRRLAGRVSVPDAKIGDLVGALLNTRFREVTRLQAATLLGVPLGRVSGALSQAQKILDVEGYEVLILGNDDVVHLDKGAMVEQFGLSR
ncbi:hypothetical protein ASD42_07730 [Nocardia sp. Root136]|uniref:hypothetical protein n=1 Tax=Nocardia sp. Root136 TaxID=1736458 RepID=UPI0006F70147|nr:hypothetical protein [Nocardia sp. Root136]KQY38319.1 hypothetical protein ASD42_07730 [Nocardia sp. Root136]